MLLVELLLVAIAGLMSSSAAGEVYCEGCNRWQAGSPLYRVHPAMCQELLERVRAQLGGRREYAGGRQAGCSTTAT